MRKTQALARWDHTFHACAGLDCKFVPTAINAEQGIACSLVGAQPCISENDAPLGTCDSGQARAGISLLPTCFGGAMRCLPNAASAT